MPLSFQVDTAWYYHDERATASWNSVLGARLHDKRSTNVALGHDDDDFVWWLINYLCAGRRKNALSWTVAVDNQDVLCFVSACCVLNPVAWFQSAHKQESYCLELKGEWNIFGLQALIWMRKFSNSCKICPLYSMWVMIA